jgi:hypothetical protein
MFPALFFERIAAGQHAIKADAQREGSARAS